MRRSLRIGGYIAIGVVTGLLVAFLAIFVISRTEWGFERVRNIAFNWLDERIEGELTFDRISGGGLLNGVRVHNFGIVDPKGRLFLRTDSIELAYSIRTLISGRIVMDEVVLYNPEVVLEKLPGDTAWNYQYVFPPGEPAQPNAERRLVMFNDARVVNGTAWVRLPFEPEGPVEPADTARIILEQVPGGTVRTMRFENLNATLDRVIWESPLEKGRLFEIASLSGRGYVWRDPFVLEDAQGVMTMRDSVITLDMPQVEMPGTSGSVLGRIVTSDGENRFDMRIETRRLAFSDLQFIYPQLPDEGGGSMLMRIQSQPDGILFLAENANLRTPGTQVAGSFGVVAGDTLYFTRVDLRASPLDVQLLEQLLPGGLPVDGLLIGTVEVSGPISALESSGDMRLESRDAASSSHLAWDGVFDLRRGRVSATRLHTDVKHLELALLSAFNPALNLKGSVSGSIDARGRTGGMQFTGVLVHASSDGGRSTFDGGGTLSGSGRSRRLDLTLNASPVTIQDLSTYVPALRGLQGDITGPVRVAGTAADLAFGADLATPGGMLGVEGRVVQEDGTRRVTADVATTAFHLEALRPTLPQTVVAGTLNVDLSGDDIASMTGPVRLLLDSARVRELPVARLALDGALDRGTLVIDSAEVRSIAGTGRARGRLALLAQSDAVLEVAFESESFAPMEPYLFEFRDDVEAAAAEPRVGGRGSALLTVGGWLGALDVTGRARGEHLVFGSTASRTLDVDIDARGLGSGSATMQLSAVADSLAVWRHTFGSATLGMSGTLDSTVVAARAFAADDAEQVVATLGVQRGAAGMSLHLDTLRLGTRAPWQLTAPATAAISGDVAVVDRLELVRAEGGLAVAAGTLAWGTAAPIDFDMNLSGVPFTELLHLMRLREPGAGTVEGRLRLYGSALDPLWEAELSAREIRYGDVLMDRAFAEASYAGLGLDAHAEAQYGGRAILTGGGRIPLDLRLTAVDERRLAEPLRVTLRADSLPPALPLNLLDGFTGAAGRLDGTVTIAGTTLDPALSGGFTLRGGAANWDVSGVGYRNVNGRFTLERDRVLRIDSLYALATDPRVRAGRDADGAGGAGRITGTLDFTALADPAFDLRFIADGAYAARRRDVEASVTGEMRLQGRYSRPEISGALRVDESTLYIDEMYRQFFIVGLELDDHNLLSLVDTTLVAVRPLLAASKNPFLRNLQVRNMQVAVGSNSWLRSRDMDVLVTGDINVALDRQEEDLRLSGALNVERGTYTLFFPPFVSRRFQVSEGTIEFPGTPGIDPNLSITASYRARASGEPLPIVATVTGTLQTPRIRLSSDAQAISESDLASYLFFGVPSWQLANTGGAQQQNGVRDMSVRALTPSVLGYASSGLQALVQNAGLLDYVSLTAADDLPGTEATTGIGSLLGSTQLELGRYIGDLYFGVTQRLATTAFTEPALRMEWRFLPQYSFELFAEDRLARAPGFGLNRDLGLRKVYGLSLFRDWTF